jgi:hypothetical protein
VKGGLVWPDASILSAEGSGSMAQLRHHVTVVIRGVASNWT